MPRTDPGGLWVRNLPLWTFAGWGQLTCLASSIPVTLSTPPPRPDWTGDFLNRDGHHLLLADVDGVPAGFVTGVEIAHPDKGVEMLLYELGVDEDYRRRGIGRALVDALKALARDLGCSGMWMPVEDRNDVATALYLATGAAEPEPGTTLWWDLR